MASATFQIQPLERFAGKNSAVRRPQEIAFFSYDESHKYKPDASSLRTYYTPALGTDLSRGFESFVKHDDSVDEHIDGLLEALMELEKKTGKVVGMDVVTWRGMMTKIMSLPFDLRSGFEMNAIKFQDTIYIEENRKYKQSTRGTSTRRQDVMSFWGYKFETLSTLPRPWDECSRELIESREDEVVSNEAQFCSIVKTGFGGVRLVIGGEVDAVWDQKPQSPTEPPNYVELKTSKQIGGDRDAIAFERKLQRIWSQSFLLGVGRIIVGFRDNDGVLRSLQEFDTQSIPGIAKKSGRDLWDGKFSIDFTSAFLEWLKESISEEGVVWRIRHQDDSVTVDLFKVDEPSFLPKSFVAWRESLVQPSE